MNKRMKKAFFEAIGIFSLGGLVALLMIYWMLGPVIQVVVN